MEGQIYVASASNGSKGIFDGIHTFEIVYAPAQNPQEPWIVYNKDVSDSNVETFATFPEIFDGMTFQISMIEMWGENDKEH